MPKHTNVLFLASSVFGGGAENHFIRLVPHLLPDARHRLAVSVIAPKELVKIDGLNFITLNKINRASYFRMIFQLARIINKFKIDLLYSFSRSANFLAFFSFIFCRKKPFWVVGVNSQPCRAYDLYPSFAGKIRLILKKYIYSTADLVICNSVSAKKELVERLRLQPEKIAIARNPVPLEEIKSKALFETEFDFINDCGFLLSVGRLCEGKGFEALLDVYKQIMNIIPYDLVILGDGPLRSALESRINKFNLKKRVHLLGWVENPFPFFRKAELYITASYWEGLPNTVLEAMALGIPVISSKSTSWIEEFSSLGACKSFPVGDKEALKRVIMEVISNTDIKNSLTAHASKIIQQFDVKLVADERNSYLRKFI